MNRTPYEIKSSVWAACLSLSKNGQDITIQRVAKMVNEQGLTFVGRFIRSLHRDGYLQCVEHCRYRLNPVIAEWRNQAVITTINGYRHTKCPAAHAEGSHTLTYLADIEF